MQTCHSLLPVHIKHSRVAFSLKKSQVMQHICHWGDCWQQFLSKLYEQNLKLDSLPVTYSLPTGRSGTRRRSQGERRWRVPSNRLHTSNSPAGQLMSLYPAVEWKSVHEMRSCLHIAWEKYWATPLLKLNVFDFTVNRYTCCTSSVELFLWM